MKIKCEKCDALYTFDEEKIPSKGIKARCKKCGHLLVIMAKNNPTNQNENTKGVTNTDSTTETSQKDPNAHLRKKNRKYSSSFTKLKEDLKQKGSEDSNGYHSFLKVLSFIDISSLNKRKASICGVIFFVIVLIQFNPTRNLLFENHLFGAIDSGAEEVIDDNMKRATIAFAIARALNAVISVIQESQLSISPAGLGVTMAVGEVFDPINDLIERFSWIMLLSLISLGVMKILIHISSWLSVDIFLSFGLLFILMGMFINEKNRVILFAVGKKAILGALIIRFAVPIVAHLNHSVYLSVLETEYEKATVELERDKKELNKINNQIGESPNNKQNSGWLDKLNSLKESMANIADIKGKIKSAKKVVSNLADTLIKLSVVFILNTVILPIGFLWLFLKVARMLFGSQFALDLEQKFRSKIFKDSKTQSTAIATV